MQRPDLLLIVAALILILGIAGSQGSYIYAVVTGQCRECPAPKPCNPGTLGYIPRGGGLRPPALSGCQDWGNPTPSNVRHPATVRL